MNLATCALCPRLCRPACPVAVGSAREAATPTAIATALVRWERGEIGAELAARAVSLCTACGACESFCHIHQPLPRALAEARRALLPFEPPEPLRALEGYGAVVAVEADERPMSRALAAVLGVPVRRWVTGDRLGAEQALRPEAASHLEAVRAHAEGSRVVIADGGVAVALEAAAVRFEWLGDVVPDLQTGLASCARSGDAAPLACCGGAGPLPRHHPDDARRVGAWWLARSGPDAVVSDARCREHLRRCGEQSRDPLDELLARAT